MEIEMTVTVETKQMEIEVDLVVKGDVGKDEMGYFVTDFQWCDCDGDPLDDPSNKHQFKHLIKYLDKYYSEDAVDRLVEELNNYYY